MNKNQVMRQTADDDETLTAKKGFFFESEKQTSADRKKLWED